MNNTVLSTAELEKFAGTYRLSDGKNVTLFVEEGKLFAKSEGLFHLPLVPLSKSKFWVNWFCERYFNFEFDDQGKVIGFTFEQKKAHEYPRYLNLLTKYANKPPVTNINKL